MSGILLIDYIIIIIYSSICITLFTAGIILLFKAKDKPEKVKNYLIGIGLFFILYGISKVIVFLYELTFDPGFVWQIKSNEFDIIFEANQELNFRNDIVWRLSTGFGTIGLIILMYELEYYIMEKKTKFIFTLIMIITLIPALLFGIAGKDKITWIRIVLYIGNFLVIVIPLFYLYLAIKTSGETRRRAIGATIGMLLFFAGIVFNSSIGKSLFESAMGIQGIYLTYFLFGSFLIIGLLIYFKSIKY
ncbi:MAG: hypothetical protein ACTSQJ_14940 [Promethearchaeota archaeon]